MSMSSIWDQHVDQEAQKEALASSGGRLIPPGKYRLTAERYEEKRNPDDFQFNPGAEYANFWCLASSEALGVTNSRQFLAVTPQTLRRGDGKLDGMTKLWHQLAKALEAEKPAEVRDRFLQYPVDCYIIAGFTKLDGSKVWARTIQEFEGYVKDGLEGKNYIQSISATK